MVLGGFLGASPVLGYSTVNNLPAKLCTVLILALVFATATRVLHQDWSLDFMLLGNFLVKPHQVNGGGAHYPYL